MIVRPEAVGVAPFEAGLVAYGDDPNVAFAADEDALNSGGASYAVEYRSPERRARSPTEISPGFDFLVDAMETAACRSAHAWPCEKAWSFAGSTRGRAGCAQEDAAGVDLYELGRGGDPRASW